jgi:branched-chain amino acid transport system permease protein
MKYAATVLALIAINAIAATGLNLVVAFCGVSLAASAYFAVGAYAYALATLTLGLDFMSATLFAVAVAVALSPAISVPAWRLRGDAFMLTTLTLQAFAYAVCYNWYSEHSNVGTLANLTNGAYGIRNIPGPSFSTRYLEPM